MTEDMRILFARTIGCKGIMLLDSDELVCTEPPDNHKLETAEHYLQDVDRQHANVIATSWKIPEFNTFDEIIEVEKSLPDGIHINIAGPDVKGGLWTVGFFKNSVECIGGSCNKSRFVAESRALFKAIKTLQ